MFKILAIDGGGMRGVIPAVLVRALERRVNKPLAECFDLIVGTSTGGLIALAMTKPDPMMGKDLIEMYRAHGETIFQKDLFSAVRPLWSAKYKPDGLEDVLRNTFGDTFLSDHKTPTLITAYDPQINSPFFFRSYRARANAEYDFRTTAVARATSAAPLFFPPAEITNIQGAQYSLLDGGLFANNPTVCGIVESLSSFGTILPELYVVSLGTGGKAAKYDTKIMDTAGVFTLIRPLLDALFQGSAATVDYQTNMLLSSTQYVRLTPPAGNYYPAMDDASASAFKSLINIANSTILHSVADLDKIAKSIT